jgi:hypothetical protein
MQEYKIIKTIFMNYFEEEYIFYNKKDNSFQIPMGIIAEFDNKWHISFDLAYISDPRDMILFSTIIIELANHQIMCVMDSSFYTIFDETGVCIDILWETTIIEKMFDTKKSYEDIRDILMKEILNKNLTENKETPIISNLN